MNKEIVQEFAKISPSGVANPVIKAGLAEDGRIVIHCGHSGNIPAWYYTEEQIRQFATGLVELLEAKRAQERQSDF